MSFENSEWFPPVGISITLPKVTDALGAVFALEFLKNKTGDTNVMESFEKLKPIKNFQISRS
jgi:hypothetical protein